MSNENEMSLMEKMDALRQSNSNITQAGSTDSKITQAGSADSNITQAGSADSNISQAGSADSKITQSDQNREPFSSVAFTPNKGEAPPKVPLFVDEADIVLGATILDYYISLADTEQVLTVDEMMKDYDPDKHENWSASFEVVDGSMNGKVIYDEEIERFPEDDSDPPKQDFYRLPLIRNGKNVTFGGFYQEDTLCLNGKGRQQLLKLG
jgi:hypothetical protein